MVGTVFKVKLAELEEKVRERFLRRMGKDLTDVFQVVSCKKRFLARFQDGCKNYLTSNQLTAVIVGNIPMKEEPEVPIIPEIPDKTVPLEKVYYHVVYVVLHFNK